MSIQGRLLWKMRLRAFDEVIKEVLEGSRLWKCRSRCCCCCW